MRKATTILGLLFLLCCKPENNQEEILYYPTKSEFVNESFLIPINLDSTRLNFSDLLQMTPGNDYRKDVPFFEIKEGNSIKKIVPFLPPYSFGNRTDVITITADSVFTDKPYSIDDLSFAMKKTIERYSKSDTLANDTTYLTRAVIDLKRNTTGKELKQVLIKTTNAFEKIKRKESNSLILCIYFGFSQSL